jgi:photosystem II stability/assembly factor-like uncharacterized protein
MDNAEAFHLNQIISAPDGALYIAGEAGFIYRSFDDGLSWDTLEPGYEGSFYGIVVVPLGPGEYELLAYGLRGNLFRSTDKGDTWEYLDSGTAVTMMSGTRLEDGTILLGGQGGMILVRAPNTTTFTPAGNPDRQSIAAMADMGDGKVLVAGLGGVRIIDRAGLPVSADSTD